MYVPNLFPDILNGFAKTTKELQTTIYPPIRKMMSNEWGIFSVCVCVGVYM